MAFETYDEQRRKAGIRKTIEEMPRGMKSILLQIFSAEGERSYYFKTCVTCSHFQTDEVCKLFNVRPPASVIASGCEKYDDIDVPF